MLVYTDAHDQESRLVNYKGSVTEDAAMFFVPYVPIMFSGPGVSPPMHRVDPWIQPMPERDGFWWKLGVQSIYSDMDSPPIVLEAFEWVRKNARAGRYKFGYQITDHTHPDSQPPLATRYGTIAAHIAENMKPINSTVLMQLLDADTATLFKLFFEGIDPQAEEDRTPT